MPVIVCHPDYPCGQTEDCIACGCAADEGDERTLLAARYYQQRCERLSAAQPQLEELAQKFAAFEAECAREALRCRDAVRVGRCECGDGRRK